MTPVEAKALRDLVDARVGAVQKAAVDVLKQYKEKLDAEHEARKPQVTINPVFEIKAETPAVNISALDTQLVLKALEHIAEVATTMPVPVVQQPDQTVEFNPTINVDLSQLEGAVDGVAQEVAASSEERGQLASALGKLTQVLSRLLVAVDAAKRSSDAVVEALSSRAQRVTTVRTEEDGTMTITES